MTSKVSTRSQTAKSASRQLAGKFPPNGGSISPIMLRFKEIFPHSTPIQLALRTGADPKHCEKCLSGARQLGAEFQQRLLQSDVGREMLIVLMGDAAPKWWVGFRRHLSIAELRRTQAQQQRALEALEREAAES